MKVGSLLSDALRKLTDNRKQDTIADRMRHRRFRFFLSFLSDFKKPLRILDLGGTQEFWERMDFIGDEDVKIVLLNRERIKVNHSHMCSVIGDARNLELFSDKSFTVVFSNSVIEHVGVFADQLRMAKEMIRVGDGYFLQTPNKYFPIEPHFLIPFFQFLPEAGRVALVRKFNCGWFRGTNRVEEAKRIRLLSRRDLRTMFPDGTICTEKVLGATKSYMVFGKT